MKYVLGLIEGIDMLMCILIATSYGHCGYKEKLEDKRNMVMYWLGYIGIITSWYIIFGDSKWGTAVEYVMGILFFQIILQGKLISKLGWYILSLVVVETSCGIVSLALIHLNYYKVVINTPILFLLFETALLFVCWVTTKIYKRHTKSRTAPKSEKIVIILIALTIFAAEGTLIGESVVLGSMKGVSGLRILIVAGIAGIAILVMGLAAIAILRFGERNRKRFELGKEYLQLQHEYYTRSLEKDEKLRAFRHDFNHHIRVLDDMAESGNMAEVKEYIKQITKEQVSTIKEIHSGHITADAIFNDYAAKCAENNIEFQVWGHFPIDFAISSYDLCTILANAMMNAFEAGMAINEYNQETDEKMLMPEILVQIRIMENQVQIQISNTALTQKEKKYYSNRDGMHGFGLQNIKAAVEKNSGYMNTRIEENKFILSIIF